MRKSFFPGTTGIFALFFFPIFAALRRMSRIIHIFCQKIQKKYCTNSHSSCIIYLHLRKCRVRVAFQEKVNEGNGTNKPGPEFFSRKSTRSTHSQEKSVQPQKHCSILQRMRQHPLKGRYITMKVTITGKNIEVSEYLRDLALKKIAKLERYFPEDTEVLITDRKSVV